MLHRRYLIPALFIAIVAPGVMAEQPSRGGVNSITEANLKEWLTYIASDELQGRATYTEGLGLAAGYISGHLKEWGVKPAGDHGTYLQTVKVQGIRTNSKASVTVDVNGQSRTFKDGEGITFSRQMGAKQTIDAGDVIFAGYGLQIPAADLNDYAEGSPKGKIVVYLGAQGPATLPAGSGRLLIARGRSAVEKGAAAVISPGSAFTGRGGTPAAPRRRPAVEASSRADNGDFTTVQRYDAVVTPQLSAQDASSNSSSAGRT